MHNCYCSWRLAQRPDSFFLHISAAQAKISRVGKPFRRRNLPLVLSSGRRWLLQLPAWRTAPFHFSGNERFAQMRALHRFAIDDLTVGTPLLSKLTHICCVSL